MKDNDMKLLVELGYNQMFNSRQTMAKAFDYVEKLANASNDSTALLTAVMVYQNTLIKQIVKHYELTEKTSDQ